MVPIVHKRASMVRSVGFLVNTGFPMCINPNHNRPSSVRKGEVKECATPDPANARKGERTLQYWSEKCDTVRWDDYYRSPSLMNDEIADAQFEGTFDPSRIPLHRYSPWIPLVMAPFVIDSCRFPKQMITRTGGKKIVYHM